MKSQYINCKTVQKWVTSSTNWLLFIFCLQQMYKHVLYLSDGKGNGVREVYRVERGAVLYCNERISTVCFTLDRIPSGRHRWLDTKGKKISALQLYIGWTVRHICSLSEDREMIIRQAETYIFVAKKPNSLNMVLTVNFRPITIRAWFDPEAMLAKHSELSCKCFLNILETKFVFVNFKNFRISFK